MARWFYLPAPQCSMRCLYTLADAITVARYRGITAITGWCGYSSLPSGNFRCAWHLLNMRVRWWLLRSPGIIRPPAGWLFLLLINALILIVPLLW